METQGFECFCGEMFGTRDELIEHNVSSHGMSDEESRTRVGEKYPQP